MEAPIFRHLRAILLLPGIVVAAVPVTLAWLGPGPVVTGSTRTVLAVVGAVCGLAGLSMMIVTIGLFVRIGRGTLAAWDPTVRLVVAGPYRHVRNPMITGVLFLLTGETLVAASPPIAAWLALVALANALYIPFVEEPALVRRFGDDYRRYCANVRRWVPRATPWSPPA